MDTQQGTETGTGATGIDPRFLAESKELAKLLTPRLNRFIPHEPTPKQAAFLLLDEIPEAFYGGAGGGGKTDALLMAGLQYADFPGYSGIIFRRTYRQLQGEDGLIRRSHDWLDGTGAKWREQKLVWQLPAGGRLYFGAMETDADKHNWDGFRFDFIGFDELTHFVESQYVYLFSRLRRKAGSPIPPRMRGGSNPGKIGHIWVKRRFITEGPSKGRAFIPARLDDNPHIDREAYTRALMNLDPIAQAQILKGDWDVDSGGVMFDRSWFEIIGHIPREAALKVRYWDLASSTSEKAKYTAGCRMSFIEGARFGAGSYVIEHMIRGKWRPGERDEVILQTARMDGPDTIVYIEQEPGSGGDTQVQYLIAKLAGYAVERHLPRGDKTTRAGPLASQAEVGNIKIVEGPWNGDFLDEVQGFPEGEYKDQVDASSGAFAQLARGPLRVS